LYAPSSPHHDLHPFPTRRSSDLALAGTLAQSPIRPLLDESYRPLPHFRPWWRSPTSSSGLERTVVLRFSVSGWLLVRGFAFGGRDRKSTRLTPVTVASRMPSSAL